ncbi:MAG TPA: MarC family protein [Thermoanaerobaculia bacterium]|nr:MarC family protein [Thermoanaerobaculia bacterium]
MSEFVRSASLLLVLLNPFLLSVYLLDLVRTLDSASFARVLTRATVIATVVFIVVSWLGERLFTQILQVRFASFLLFGGVIFPLVGIRFVLEGPAALTGLRGDPKHLEGSIALPFMIGPGTVSASVLAGARLGPLGGAGAIASATVLAAIALMLLKRLHDVVKERNEELVERYVDIVGRVMSLVIGTYSIEMILQGLEQWSGNGTPPLG